MGRLLLDRLVGTDTVGMLVRPVGTAVTLPTHTVSGLLTPLLNPKVADGSAGVMSMLIRLKVPPKLLTTSAWIPRVELH